MSISEHFTQRTSLGYLAIPRVVLGFLFLQFGWQKMNPRFLSGEQLVAQLSRAASDPVAWHRDFIMQTVIPHSELFGHIVA